VLIALIFIQGAKAVGVSFLKKRKKKGGGGGRAGGR